MVETERIRDLASMACAGKHLDRAQGLEIVAVPDGSALYELLALAGKIRETHRGRRADLCAIVSAKTGACPEDCAYCAQSSRSSATILTHPLMDGELIMRKATEAKAGGARRFSIVTSGHGPTPDELIRIRGMISAIRDLGLSPCASLGMISADALRSLRDAGLNRYHHNLETSRAYFPRICSTHSYDDKLRTIEAVHEAGLSLCSGGIVGMGESWADRIALAIEARGAGVDSVPINFLQPIAGTPLGEHAIMRPMEALKVIALFRFLLPQAEVRLAGGRIQCLGEFNSMVFLAGADGLITGDCLTTAGRRPDDDIDLAKAYGMHVQG